MNVVPTGAIFYAVCDIRSDRCSAPEGGAVTAVMNEAGEQINVCKTCLDHQVKFRLWHIEGARVPGMKEQLDIAAIDRTGRVVVIVEVKTKLASNEAWATDTATRLMSRTSISTATCLMIFTPEVLYAWEVIERRLLGETCVVSRIGESVSSMAKELKLDPSEYAAEPNKEIRGAPHTAAKRHMQLERIAMGLLRKPSFLDSVPLFARERLANTELLREYVV
ncbi:hypothetical protein [Paraburkholderia tropica]|uniref:hypothetical protein n=1 Tax=Paraburkholderia tropica TaxID=92647 RepID=UPI0015910CA6|nr:hypothetical protein [Paraburkholderia tropica]